MQLQEFQDKCVAMKIGDESDFVLDIPGGPRMQTDFSAIAFEINQKREYGGHVWVSLKRVDFTKKVPQYAISVRCSH